MKKIKNKLSSEQLVRAQSLRDMIKLPLAQNLIKINDLLKPLDEAILLEDVARKTGISQEGIITVCRSTVNDIQIFSEIKERKEIWYVKIKKKQP